MKLRLTLFPRKPPVIKRGSSEYVLQSPWNLQAEMRPLYWGKDELLTLSGDFIEPLRGWRFHAVLETEQVDLNDHAILMDLRRRQETFYFYPFQGWKFYFSVKIKGDILVYRPSGPESFSLKVEMMGTNIFSSDDMNNIILSSITGTFDASTSTLTIDWEPFVDVGILNITAYLDNETPVGAESFWIGKGRGKITCSDVPTYFVWEYPITGSTGEVTL